MLDFNSGGTFRAKNERRRLRRIVVDRSWPLYLERFGQPSHILSHDIGPMGDQLRRCEALFGENVAQTTAHQVGERARERSDGLVHADRLWQAKAMTVTGRGRREQANDKTKPSSLKPGRRSTLASQQAAPRPLSAALLAWYDAHRRRLPWRAEPGEASDPYAVWLSEIMLQQTTVQAVKPYYAKFLARWPSVLALASASLDDVLREWAGLGYYARARNLHACAQAVVTRHDGIFPHSEAELLRLPGIGSYTAAAIAAIAFGRHATPVDGNIERVIARIYAVEEALPAAKPRIRALARDLTPALRAGDYAQALMDLGATICTPRKPACILCPWNACCAARARGGQETFPRKAPKREGKLRSGVAFWVLRDDGCVLVRTRPSKGLLGGMSEIPTTEWTESFGEDSGLNQAPVLRVGLASEQLEWRRLPGIVRHTFTHFPLELVVLAASVPAATPSPAGMRWVAHTTLPDEAFPSLMRKVAAHAMKERLTPCGSWDRRMAVADPIVC